MPLNTNIPLGFRPPQIETPTNALMQVLQLQNEQRKNELGGLQLREQQDALTDRATDRTTLRGLAPGATDDDRINALMRGGTASGYTLADTLRKSALDRRKTDSEIGKNNATSAQTAATTAHDAVTRTLGSIPTQYDPQAIGDWYAEALRNKVPNITMQSAQAQMARIPKDAAGYADWRRQQLLTGTALKEQIEATLPKFDWKDTGGALAPFQTNPMAGSVGPAAGMAPVAKSQTPDGKAANNLGYARLAKETQAASKPIFDPTRGVMVDPSTGTFKPVANAADGTPMGGKPKPQLPTTALKMQQESLEAIGAAAGINADLNALIKRIDDGKLKLGPYARADAFVRNNTNNSNDNSRSIADMQASLMKMQNDSLRLNKGVQTEGDAVRAWQEIQANPNDEALVKSRLKIIAGLNARAVDLHKAGIEVIRQNFDAAPLDTSRFGVTDSPLAPGSAPPAPGGAPRAPAAGGVRSFNPATGRIE